MRPARTTGVLILLAAIGYAAFVGWQRTAKASLMDLRLLARRPVAAGAFLILIATALMLAVFFLGTFYFQHTLGYGALLTGLLFLPVAVATILGANLTGRVIGRLGARLLEVVGLLAAAVGMAVPAVWLQPWTAVLGVSIAAAGTGAIFVVASTTALGQVEPHEAGVASGIVSMDVGVWASRRLSHETNLALRIRHDSSGSPRAPTPSWYLLRTRS